MFLRVPGPTDLLDTVATISAYFTFCTRDTAYTIGIVAWPPQVTMLTFISRLPACCLRLIGGTQYGPIAAGVRSIIITPSALSLSELALRSEEHTSALQSLMRISDAVFCLKKKNKTAIYQSCNYHLLF